MKYLTDTGTQRGIRIEQLVCASVFVPDRYVEIRSAVEFSGPTNNVFELMSSHSHNSCDNRLNIAFITWIEQLGEDQRLSCRRKSTPGRQQISFKAAINTR